LTLLKGARTIAVHTLDYKGSPVLAAFITTGAQFGGLAIEGTEDTFDVTINGYTSKRPAREGHWPTAAETRKLHDCRQQTGFQSQSSFDQCFGSPRRRRARTSLV
jgi:hypothetical protein